MVALIIDGLVFYDQFSRLKTHQIVLVSIGVGLLLFGVWVVSFVEPTGQGGVDMGTWVEEDEGENSLLLSASHENFTEHPQSYHDDPIGQSPTRPDMARSNTFPSPTSPKSPTSPASTHRRRIRYGTLVPELAPVNAPTGFSIGLGAASPGFVLRPEGFDGSGHGEGRVRSRSEGARGIQEIMSGARTGNGARGLGILGADLENTGPAETESGDPNKTSAREDERGVVDPSWWNRLFRRDGQIKLDTD